MDASIGNWIWVLVAIAVIWFFMRRGGMHGHGLGHGRSDGGVSNGGNGHHGRHDDAAGATAGPAAALDPVSGNPVRTDRAVTAVFAGRAYYFESDDTRKRFEAEPQKYTTAAPAVEQPRRRHGC